MPTIEMQTKCETSDFAAASSRRFVPSTFVWRDLRKGLEAQWMIVCEPLTAKSNPSPCSDPPVACRVARFGLGPRLHARRAKTFDHPLA